MIESMPIAKTIVFGVFNNSVEWCNNSERINLWGDDDDGL